MHTYTDTLGAVTTTNYDMNGRPTTVVDPKGTTTYTYDGVTGEHRGLVTTLADSLAGSFTATYDADSKLATQTYPGGIVATYSYDNVGALIDINYANGSVSWLEFTAHRDGQSRIATVNNAAGTVTTYGYDNAGRLTTATDNAAGTCTTRAYGFNANSDRTSLATSSFAATAGACTGSGTPTTVNHSYDQADRITDTGYTYDDFGRTLTVPSADAGGQGTLTPGYYTNDLVQQIAGILAGAATTKIYGLDPAGRVLTEAVSGAATLTDHYAAGGDSPSWTATSDGNWTRNVAGLDGNTDAAVTYTAASSTTSTSLQLIDIHGNVAATATPTGTGLAATFTYDEFGNATNPNSLRYGWLGGKERAQAGIGNLALMGVRLYDPATGRFLQVDPVPGGSANDYDYAAQDPINGWDLSGTVPVNMPGGYPGGFGLYFAGRAAAAAEGRAASGGAGRAVGGARAGGRNLAQPPAKPWTGTTGVPRGVGMPGFNKEFPPTPPKGTYKFYIYFFMQTLKAIFNGGTHH